MLGYRATNGHAAWMYWVGGGRWVLVVHNLVLNGRWRRCVVVVHGSCSDVPDVANVAGHDAVSLSLPPTDQHAGPCAVALHDPGGWAVALDFDTVGAGSADGSDWLLLPYDGSGMDGPLLASLPLPLLGGRTVTSSAGSCSPLPCIVCRCHALLALAVGGLLTVEAPPTSLSSCGPPCRCVDESACLRVCE